VTTGKHVPGGANSLGMGDRASALPQVLALGYYSRVFALMHAQLEDEGPAREVCHPTRRRYWGLLPHRVYRPDEARPLLVQYLHTVERELASILQKHCIGYWLHLYRRLAPEPIGTDKQPMTVGLVRATLEAAIQKYARFEPCDGVGITGDVSIGDVLGGILMESEFRRERDLLEREPQLVLTRFATPDLREFYDAEKLAYEVWRTSAMLRITAKGAPIVVDGSDACVWDVRSTELARLVWAYDCRWARWQDRGTSAPGVVFDPVAMPEDRPGIEFLPSYNVGRVDLDLYGGFLSELCGVPIGGPMPPNFIWFPSNLREYRDAHLGFSKAFGRKHGVDLDVLVTILVALCQRVWFAWRRAGTRRQRAESILHDWQRAYEGPSTRDFLREEIAAFIPVAAQRLALPEGRVARDELDAAFGFLELNDAKRPYIDLAYAGPHYVFLPYGSERLFLDYAWIGRRLYDLFLGVRLDDQNFKGDALEGMVRKGSSVLPLGACRARDGESKQVDASFALGERLIIVECRAVWRSVGFDRGDFEAIRYRNEMTDTLLADVDAKAQWLAARPVGANYDISHFVDILPLGVTPFAEYIPSLDSRYWLSNDLPRVLTPGELRLALEDGTLSGVSTNVVPVAQSK
jgi:hypothetical protein